MNMPVAVAVMAVELKTEDFRLPGAPNPLDRQLWARNKWLIAHPDSAPAAKGAVIGLTGENIDIAGDL